ncbi:low molecular weight protein tyrosine phosphatase family protein [Arenimonas sp.]|uniref:low molecular weight protein tyrosine phosphatase family protein n=1 Tax=Arenimonas sp. TaxID=1872635 RepID=UPI0039E4B02B
MKDDPLQTKEKREKNWKLLYLRSAKLARAKQLGIDYPNTSSDGQTEGDEPLNILFVCSRNQWRSPSAEAVWRNHPDIRARSAGTSPNARRRVSIDDIRWSHSIFVMEEKHRSRLLAEFSRAMANKPIHVLDIPDEYQYMDPELVDMLRASVSSILGLP